MSLHSNDMNPIITRDNYEEYFLMYVDDELTPEERSMVEAFLLLHPELHAELDMLMSTKLEPEMISFANKEELFAENMSQNLVDEALLLHVDNELPEGEKEKVERRLQQEPAYNNQYQWLLRTKSDPAEVIPYPNKEELYRHTVRRIGFAPALRIAAAVLIIASMGVLWWTQDNGGDNNTTAPTIAANPGKATPTTTEENAVANNSNNTNIDKVQEDEQPAAVPQQKVIELQQEQPQLQLAKVEKAQQSLPRKANEAVAPRVKELPVQEPVANEQLAQAPVPRARSNSEELNNVIASLPSKKDFENGVTSANADPYQYTEAVAAPQFASAKDDDGRGNKNNLKSLLRKATRLVERRTGIDATNEEDELIIGAMAIKLK